MSRQPRKRNVTPRPFLKWVGGKSQLLDELMQRVDAVGVFGRYHEPFLGGGALFFELARLKRLGRKKAWLSDNNVRLIETYHGVQQNVERVITLLERHKSRHEEQYYYQVRDRVPEDPIERAARIIYLNRTCFNGLFRENSKGLFNVPCGRYVDPPICDAANLRAVATVLSKTCLESRSFDDVVDRAERGDLVYFDPPYHPVSKTANFTAYHQQGFGENEQRRLAEVYAALDAKGVRVLLSNSYTPLIQNLYADFAIDTVSATRRVNSRADRRGSVREVIVRNFEL